MNVIEYANKNPKQFKKDLTSGKIAVSVHGQGYVGLPLAVLLALKGVRVYGVVRDPEKREMIRGGKSPFFETDPNSLKKKGAKEILQKCTIDGIRLFTFHGKTFCPVCLRSFRIQDGLPLLTQETIKLPHIKTLDDYLKDALKKGTYTVVPDNLSATKESMIHIIAVPTWADDYSIVLDVSKDIAQGLTEDGHIIINKSTVPVGATDEAEVLAKKNTKFKFGMCHMQERIAEGRALKEFQDLPRTVGSHSKKANFAAKELFELLGSPVYEFDSPKITEASKIFENSYRDCNIAIANNFALFCEDMGLDVYQVIQAANTNLKTHVFQPGMIGGHCLPEDTYYVAEPMKRLGKLNTIMAGRKLNEYIPHHAVELLEAGLKERGRKLEGSRICIFGVAFKGNTDDIRLSGCKFIAEDLKEKGAKVFTYDPWVQKADQEKFGEPVGLDEGLDMDGIIIGADHTQFYSTDFSKGASKVIVDVRNMVKNVKKAESEGKTVLKFGVGK